MESDPEPTDPGAYELVARDDRGELVVVSLPPSGTRALLGRSPSNDVVIDWDEAVSRTHVELERVGEFWTVTDNGLSRNGTFLNGERLVTRRRLEDGDILRVGATDVLFRAPADETKRRTALAPDATSILLTAAQRRVLTCLARPYARGGGYPTPASNGQIAEELHLSLDAVKGHLRALFEKFALGDLPQNQKRARLVAQALQLGVISEHELS